MNNKQIVFVMAGVLMLALSVFAAVELMDVVERGQEIKDLQQKIADNPTRLETNEIH